VVVAALQVVVDRAVAYYAAWAVEIDHTRGEPMVVRPDHPIVDQHSEGIQEP
jgi:hypothetical protein